MARGLATRQRDSLVKSTLVPAILGASVIGALAGGFGYRLYASIEQLRASVDQANAIIEATGNYLDALRDAETSQRGYLLTMRPSYLEPFWTSGSAYENASARLAELTRGSPELEAEAAALRSVGQQKMTELNQTVQHAMHDGPQAALPEVLTDFGKAAMDSVRQHVSRINAAVLAQRSTRTGELIRNEQRILIGILLAALSGIALLGAAALVLLLGRNRLVTVQRALRRQSERLRGTVEHIPEGIAVFDASGRLLLCNAGFCPSQVWLATSVGRGRRSPTLLKRPRIGSRRFRLTAALGRRRRWSRCAGEKAPCKYGGA